MILVTALTDWWISFGVLWLLIVENLLIAIKNCFKIDAWAQLSAIIGWGAITTGIDYSHALLVVGGYVVVGAAIASLLFVRRDVSN